MKAAEIEFTLNDRPLLIGTVGDLGVALDLADAEQVFELSVALPDGPVLTLLRNGTDAWLMYLNEPDDVGVRSQGDPARLGNARYTLSNGQVDEYPLAWCVDVEQCYRAVAYFFVNDGERPPWLSWAPS